jgi:hypothetical protein
MGLRPDLEERCLRALARPGRPASPADLARVERELELMATLRRERERERRVEQSRAIRLGLRLDPSEFGTYSRFPNKIF